MQTGYINKPERFVMSEIKNHTQSFVAILVSGILDEIPDYREHKLPNNYFFTIYENKPKLPRNSLCKCGSGLKHKRCCGINEG